MSDFQETPFRSINSCAMKPLKSPSYKINYLLLQTCISIITIQGSVHFTSVITPWLQVRNLGHAVGKEKKGTYNKC